METITIEDDIKDLELYLVRWTTKKGSDSASDHDLLVVVAPNPDYAINYIMTDEVFVPDPEEAEIIDVDKLDDVQGYRIRVVGSS